MMKNGTIHMHDAQPQRTGMTPITNAVKPHTKMGDTSIMATNKKRSSTKKPAQSCTALAVLEPTSQFVPVIDSTVVLESVPVIANYPDTLNLPVHDDMAVSVYLSQHESRDGDSLESFLAGLADSGRNGFRAQIAQLVINYAITHHVSVNYVALQFQHVFQQIGQKTTNAKIRDLINNRRDWQHTLVTWVAAGIIDSGEIGYFDPDTEKWIDLTWNSCRIHPNGAPTTYNGYDFTFPVEHGTATYDVTVHHANPFFCLPASWFNVMYGHSWGEYNHQHISDYLARIDPKSGYLSDAALNMYVNLETNMQRQTFLAGLLGCYRHGIAPLAGIADSYDCAVNGLRSRYARQSR